MNMMNEPEKEDHDPEKSHWNEANDPKGPKFDLQKSLDTKLKSYLKQQTNSRAFFVMKTQHLKPYVLIAFIYFCAETAKVLTQGKPANIRK